MVQATFKGIEKVGKINIERYKDSIRLRWQLQGERYSLTIGKESKDTIKAARAKAALIDGDITFERFDPTLVKYGKQYKATKLGVVSEGVIPPQQKNLRELWDGFLKEKLPTLKAKSQVEYHKFTAIIDKLGDRLTYDGLETKKALLSVTTQDQTRRVLMYLSACCKWGLKHGLCDRNPFEGVTDELPTRKQTRKNQPMAFNQEEVKLVLSAFEASKYYSCYSPLVQFWFKTGCRPSEAIGLQWKHISPECDFITFEGSIQCIAGKLHWSEGSKNNKTRKVAVSESVRNLLLQIRPDNPEPNHPVFSSPRGKFINYENFCKRSWTLIVHPIKPGTTPYNCRDTFITEQILKGIPPAVIAKWCDTSTKMIEEHYADKLRLSAIRPLD